MEWPLAWAKESVEGSACCLSLTAQSPGMRARIRRSEFLQWYFCGDNGSSGWVRDTKPRGAAEFQVGIGDELTEGHQFSSKITFRSLQNGHVVYQVNP